MRPHAGRMNATIPEGRRTAAAWIAATGAFLLVAAGALFIAVRWDELSDAAKLGVLTAVTGAAIAGGRAAQKELPATGSVVFHLGAFLVPVDIAAALMRLELDWRAFLFVGTTATTAAFVGLALASRSRVLWWTAAGGVVAFAAGVAAVSPLPAGLVLAAIAAAALLADHQRVATIWAAAAGLGPVAAAGFAAMIASGGGSLGLGMLDELGLAGKQPGAILAGATSAAVLGLIATRRTSLGHAFLAAACAVASGLLSWLSLVDRGAFDAVGAAVLFFGVELAVLATREPFWRRLTAPVAMASEAIAAVITLPVMGFAVLLAPLADKGLDIFTDDPGWSPQPALGAAAAITAMAWTAAALRITRPQTLTLRRAVADVVGAPLTVLPVALSVVAAVAVGTASPLATACTATALALLLAATERSFALLLAAGLAFWAPVTAHESPEAAALLGSLGAVAIAASVRRHHLLAVVPSLIAGSAAAVVGWATMSTTIGSGASMTAAVVVLWLSASMAGESSTLHGHLARGSLLIPLAIAAALPAEDAFFICSAVGLLLSVDTWRLADEGLGVAAVTVIQLPIALGAHLTGFDLPGVGLVMCGAAVVAAGLGALFWPRWQAPTVAAAVTPLILGLSLASADPSAFGTALLITGGVAFVAALVSAQTWLAHVGGVFTTAAIATHLLVAGVESSEPYLAPVALHLVLLGWQLRKEESVDSWAAYGPAVAFLGGAALVERMSGGGAWHAVVAGAVGVIAVSAGGWFRLIAPLLLGTGLLVMVTVYESLATLATVPTWAWLAAGGSLLLGVGVALERTGTSPVEAGRKVADVLSSRFD